MAEGLWLCCHSCQGGLGRTDRIVRALIKRNPAILWRPDMSRGHPEKRTAHRVWKFTQDRCDIVKPTLVHKCAVYEVYIIGFVEITETTLACRLSLQPSTSCIQGIPGLPINIKSCLCRHWRQLLQIRSRPNTKWPVGLKRSSRETKQQQTQQAIGISKPCCSCLCPKVQASG